MKLGGIDISVEGGDQELASWECPPFCNSGDFNVLKESSWVVAVDGGHH